MALWDLRGLTNQESSTRQIFCEIQANDLLGGDRRITFRTSSILYFLCGRNAWYAYPLPPSTQRNHTKSSSLTRKNTPQPSHHPIQKHRHPRKTAHPVHQLTDPVPSPDVARPIINADPNSGSRRWPVDIELRQINDRTSFEQKIHADNAIHLHAIVHCPHFYLEVINL